VPFADAHPLIFPVIVMTSLNGPTCDKPMKNPIPSSFSFQLARHSVRNGEIPHSRMASRQSALSHHVNIGVPTPKLCHLFSRDGLFIPKDISK
jgi:hypothetical protein